LAAISATVALSHSQSAFITREESTSGCHDRSFSVLRSSLSLFERLSCDAMKLRGKPTTGYATVDFSPESYL
jgi:hypothetical protein